MPVEFSTRAGLSSLLDESRRELETAFQGLSDEQMLLPLRNDWSVKDVLAHIAMWEEMEAADILRAARGDTPVLRSFDFALLDEWNHLQFVLRRDLPLEQVMRELAETRRAITALLGSIEEDRFTTGYVPMAYMHSVRHDQRHAEQIREWRQAQRI